MKKIKIMMVFSNSYFYLNSRVNARHYSWIWTGSVSKWVLDLGKGCAHVYLNILFLNLYTWIHPIWPAFKFNLVPNFDFVKCISCNTKQTFIISPISVKIVKQFLNRTEATCDKLQINAQIKILWLPAKFQKSINFLLHHNFFFDNFFLNLYTWIHPIWPATCDKFQINANIQILWLPPKVQKSINFLLHHNFFLFW